MNSKMHNITNTRLQKLINTTIQDFTDCSLCNICCLEGTLYLNGEDIKKISKFLKMDPKSMVYQYTTYNKKTWEIKVIMPCSFLKKNECIIYPVRPMVCRNYPVFAQKNDIVYVYGIETCATATIFCEAYADYLAAYYPDCYKKLKKNLDKDLSLKDDDMINMQFSKEHIELFVKWLNKKMKNDK